MLCSPRASGSSGSLLFECGKATVTTRNSLWATIVPDKSAASRIRAVPSIAEGGDLMSYTRIEQPADRMPNLNCKKTK